MDATHSLTHSHIQCSLSCQCSNYHYCRLLYCWNVRLVRLFLLLASNLLHPHRKHLVVPLLAVSGFIRASIRMRMIKFHTWWLHIRNGWSLANKPLHSNYLNTFLLLVPNNIEELNEWTNGMGDGSLHCWRCIIRNFYAYPHIKPVGHLIWHVWSDIWMIMRQSPLISNNKYFIRLLRSILPTKWTECIQSWCPFDSFRFNVQANIARKPPAWWSTSSVWLCLHHKDDLSLSLPSIYINSFRLFDWFRLCFVFMHRLHQILALCPRPDMNGRCKH